MTTQHPSPVKEPKALIWIIENGTNDDLVRARAAILEHLRAPAQRPASPESGVPYEDPEFVKPASPESARLADWLTHYATCFIDDERVGRRMLEIVAVLRAPAQCAPGLNGVSMAIEACAKIADQHWEQNDQLSKSPGWDSACIQIARAIRALSVTSTVRDDPA